MKKAITKRRVVKVLATLLILLVVIGLTGIIVKFTSGLTTNFKTFYINVDGKDIMSKAEGYTLGLEDSLKVNVKYTFSSSENLGYTIKVVPNKVEGKDFDFSIDGEVYSFQAEKDLTNGFDIEKNETYFTIKPKGNITKILGAVYPNNRVEIDPSNVYSNMYSLIVTSFDGKQSTTLNFAILEFIYGVTLDKEVIVF